MADNIRIFGIIALIAALIAGGTMVKYWIWSVQHPNAPTWSFFIPDGK